MMAHRHGALSKLLAILMVASIAFTAFGAAPSSAAAAGRRPKDRPTLDQILRKIDTQLIVRFKAGISGAKANAAIHETGGKVKKTLPYHNTRLAAYTSATAAKGALKTLGSDPRVVYAFYNQRFKLPEKPTVPSLSDLHFRKGGRDLGRKPLPGTSDRTRQPLANSDPLSTEQYHLDRIGATRVPTPTRPAPVVAVIDTGMDYTHPDLARNYQRCPSIPARYCDLIGFDNDPYDGNGHGSLVAGTLAARKDGQGVTGVSPTSKILPVKIFDDIGFTDLATIFQGIDYVREAKRYIPNLRVANMSFGGYVLAGSPEHREFNDRMFQLKQAGILPVVAPDNDSSFILQFAPLVYGVEVHDVPAQSPAAFAVAATDGNDYRTFYSNYSTPIKVNSCRKKTEYGECRADNTYTNKVYNYIRVAAPGWQVLSTAPEGEYRGAYGTSFAAPIAAGVAARVMAKYPELTNDQVTARIRNTGVPLGTRKGFPLTTRRVDLRRALGGTGTGFTGRVVDGVTGQPLKGAKVSFVAGGRTFSGITNGAGFYTIAGGRGGTGYSIKATRPGYITDQLRGSTVSGYFNDPGELSLVPARTDGGYTIIADWKNVYTGIDEFFREEYITEFSGGEPAPADHEDEPGRRYPWPVKSSTMPFTLLDAYFGVPYPTEPRDSAEFATLENPGSLATYPYARVMHDAEWDAVPHEAVIVRQLPIAGSLRYGIKWLSPQGYAKTGVDVRVYRNSTILKRSVLANSQAPTDGTRGDGRRDGSTWALYNINSNRKLTTKTTDPDGQRTDSNSWIFRNNDIPGTRGPGPGANVSAQLDVNYDDSDEYFIADWVDVYNVGLAGGKTYTFNLKGPRRTDYGLLLFRPGTVSIYYFDYVKYADKYETSTETLKYTVPAGKGGKYYIAVYANYGTGQYTLSRPK